MSINEYLKIPPPTPSIQSPPVSQHPPQFSLNDQIKLCSMKYKITKNFAEMFKLSNLVISPFRNMLILHFMVLLIEKYKNDPDQPLLVRLHGIIDSAFRTTSISLPLVDECIYHCNNPRVIEAIYLFTTP
jgi:hypothetical protein